MTGIVAPRILIGAPASGGGKTTFTCGLLHALVRRGLKAAACKCGPDYIDPMFHSEVIGAFSRNLDLFFSTEEQVRQLVADSATASQSATKRRRGTWPVPPKHLPCWSSTAVDVRAR